MPMTKLAAADSELKASLGAYGVGIESISEEVGVDIGGRSVTCHLIQ